MASDPSRSPCYQQNNRRRAGFYHACAKIDTNERELVQHLRACPGGHTVVSRRGQMAYGCMPNALPFLRVAHKVATLETTTSAYPCALQFYHTGELKRYLEVIPTPVLPDEPDNEFNEAVDTLAALCGQDVVQLPPARWNPPNYPERNTLKRSHAKLFAEILEANPASVAAPPLPRSNSLGPRVIDPLMEGEMRLFGKRSTLTRLGMKQVIKDSPITLCTVALPKYNDFKTDGTMRTIYAPSFTLDLVLRHLFYGLSSAIRDLQLRNVQVHFLYGKNLEQRVIPKGDYYSYDLRKAEYQYFPLVLEFFKQNFPDLPEALVDPKVIIGGVPRMANHFQSGLYPTTIFNVLYTAAFAVSHAPIGTHNIYVDGDAFLSTYEVHSGNVTRNPNNEMNGFLYIDGRQPQYMRFKKKFLTKRYIRNSGLRGAELFKIRVKAYRFLNMSPAHLRLAQIVADSYPETDLTREAAEAGNFDEFKDFVQRKRLGPSIGNIFNQKKLVMDEAFLSYERFSKTTESPAADVTLPIASVQALPGEGTPYKFNFRCVHRNGKT